MAQLIAPLTNLAVFLQDPVQAGDRAQVRAFIQEGRVDLPRWAVLEARAVEDLAHLHLLPRAESSRRGSPGPRRAGGRRPTPAVKPAARHLQRPAGSAHPDDRRQVFDGLDHGRFPFSSSVAPKSCASFFWASMMASACPSLRLRRSFSRRSWASSAAWGSGLRPRRRGARPFNWPASRWRRHLLRCEEYNPSRRKRAPCSPLAHCSASCRMRNLYSAVKRRRSGFASTSLSSLSWLVAKALTCDR